MEKSESYQKSGIGLSLLKGVITAIFATLIGVLIFALIIKLAGLSSSVIRPVNQVIKGASIFVGTLVGLKGRKEKGLIKGLLIGLVYAIVSFALFSLLNGSFAFNKSLVIDILFLSAMGAISGALCMFILRK